MPGAASNDDGLTTTLAFAINSKTTLRSEMKSWNVHTGNNYQYQEGLHEIIRKIAPDVMVGVGWIAAYILKLADPACKLIYMTTGCEWIKMYAGLKRTNDFLSFSQNSLSYPERITGSHTLERRTIELADFVVTHSDMNLQLHRTLYASSAGKNVRQRRLVQ